jgi:hypothetical protein
MLKAPRAAVAQQRLPHGAAARGTGRSGEKPLRRSVRRDAGDLNQNVTSKIVSNYPLVTRRILPGCLSDFSSN